MNSILTISPEVISLIPSEMARNFQVVPLKLENNCLTVMGVGQPDISFREEMELILGYEIQFVAEKNDVVSRTIEKYYQIKTENKEAQFELNANEDQDFIAKIISDAKSYGSSDIHFEIYEDKARIRIRVDGVLREKYQINLGDYSEIVNKIKIRAKLNITEKRLPQDGRIQFQGYDLRVSILPTLHGEKIVLRILSKDASNISLQNLGFSQDELESYIEGVKKSNGLVLISGPTGSGKTTTLYATLSMLNEEKRNIVTVEDPIEYTLKGINQVQLKEDIGLGFPEALKSFLRQDPDIIMLGEIRDGKTAKMAIQAAQTGHLVLSTIHTNSAWGTISRLLDMGVEPFLVANSLNVSVAQRLVRKLCTCKEVTTYDSKDFPERLMINDKIEGYKPIGCNSCQHSGFKGRQALYEVIPIDPELSLAIKENKFSVTDMLKERGIKSLSQLALELVINGVSSLEEVYPILSEE